MTVRPAALPEAPEPAQPGTETPWEDPSPALKSALHELRDHLPAERVLHVGARLPFGMRGTYFQGWSSTETLPNRSRTSCLSQGSADDLEAVWQLLKSALREASETPQSIETRRPRSA